MLLRTRDQGSWRKRARPDPHSTLPQGWGALQILRFGLHGSPRGRKFVHPTRPTFLGSPNPLLRRFPTEEPQPGFLSGGGACTAGLGAGASGRAPPPRRGLEADGQEGAGRPGGRRGWGQPRAEGRGAILAGCVGRAHSPPRDPVEQHAGGGARRNSQAAGQAGRGAAGQQRAHSLHGSRRERWAVAGGGGSRAEGRG